AGRPRDEHHAVGLREGVLEGVERLRLEAERVERQREVRAVEDAHDDLLAVERREDRDAEVDLTALDLGLEFPVLKNALLGDVERGHDLDAAADGALPLLVRGRAPLVQDAVLAEADTELLLLGLDVDIRNAVLHNLKDEEVHEL